MKITATNYFLSLLIGISFFTSCTTQTSSKSEEVQKGAVSSVNDETSSCSINKDLIVQWSEVRTNKDSVVSLFQNHGNSFTFTKTMDQMPKADSIIHAYIGYDAATNALSFTVLTANSDTVGNTSCLTFAPLSAQKDTLASFEEVSENNKDSISWKLANKRINRWRNDNKRNKWIDECFSPDDSTQVFQAFAINTIDFEYGEEHQCFLSLKKVMVKGKKQYRPDLIIVNTTSDEIVSFSVSAASADVEDLATPVPPFDPRTPSNTFSLLEQSM
ncbi:hypothetical protein MY04_4169 [Flammeovirga sp. MY04]|uniref:hypothetical protein n=1 Tax=Flammeovirga sp. MY04 TaxID=1191459 RepID=UPI0008063DFB|nr:hypothetical protein [Flammeovirga sp. MY04]ANQ51513.1 hypothetical protein MY04_4169 [Flammeovirga sp. MY04]